MNKTLQSLHILKFINNLIKRYINSLNVEVSNNVDGNSVIYLGIKSIILILAKSFLDEWNDGLICKTEQNDKDRLIELKQKALPAINRIRKWNDIDEFRNSILAHNFRKGKKFKYESAFIGSHIDSLNVPDHITELVLLSELIDIATSIICEPFKEELDKTINNLFANTDIRKPTIVDVQKELDEIKKQINP